MRCQKNRSTRLSVRPGQQSVSTARQDCYIIRQYIRNGNMPAARTAATMITRHGWFTADTVRRRLRSAGLLARRPYAGPNLTCETLMVGQVYGVSRAEGRIIDLEVLATITGQTVTFAEAGSLRRTTWMLCWVVTVSNITRTYARFSTRFSKTMLGHTQHLLLLTYWPKTTYPLFHLTSHSLSNYLTTLVVVSLMALQQEWRLVPQITIHRLISSMRQCCMACVNVRGGHTRYWVLCYKTYTFQTTCSKVMTSLVLWLLFLFSFLFIAGPCHISNLSYKLSSLNVNKCPRTVFKVVSYLLNPFTTSVLKVTNRLLDSSRAFIFQQPIIINVYIHELIGIQRLGITNWHYVWTKNSTLLHISIWNNYNAVCSINKLN